MKSSLSIIIFDSFVAVYNPTNIFIKDKYDFLSSEVKMTKPHEGKFKLISFKSEPSSL